MQMIDNYLFSLENYLPENIRQEVREELESSILDQVEDKQASLGRQLTGDELEELLKNIGHPMRVAAAYLPKQQLIGPDYFPAYKRALEIGMAIVVGIVILLSLPSIFTVQSVIGSTIKIFAQTLYTGTYVFALITIIFYLMEKHGASLDKIYAWSPKDLKSYSRRLALSRMETGFELIVYILFLSWWNNFMSWPTERWFDSQVIEVSLSAEWHSVFWSVNVVMGLSIAIGLHQFIMASWNRFTLAADMALSLATLTILSQIVQFDQLVVYDGELMENAGIKRLADNLDYAVYSILTFIGGICVWDIYNNFRKIIGR